MNGDNKVKMEDEAEGGSSTIQSHNAKEHRTPRARGDNENRNKVQQRKQIGPFEATVRQSKKDAGITRASGRKTTKER